MDEERRGGEWRQGAGLSRRSPHGAGPFGEHREGACRLDGDDGRLIRAGVPLHGAVLRRGHRPEASRREGRGRPRPRPAQAHVRGRADGPLARGDGVVRCRRQGSLLGRWIWQVRRERCGGSRRVGLRSPPLLLRHRRQVRRADAGPAEEGRRSRHPGRLSAARPRAEGRRDRPRGEAVHHLELLRR